MKYPNNKANVLIYSLVLVNLALLLALAMFNNFFVFLSNTERGNTERKLSNNILYKGELFAKYVRTMNSNGSGYVDTIGCPSSVSMSGDTVVSTTTPVLMYTGSVNRGMYCVGYHSGSPYYLYFSPDFTGFSGAVYINDPREIVAGIGQSPFIDSDNTIVDITGGLPTAADGFDDNFNSDNYRASSSGTTMYPGGYSDDDIVPKISIYGYISPEIGFSNIWWANDKVHNYINANPNNADDIYGKSGTTSSGVLYLDADRSFDMKLVQFDKNSYNTTKELIATSQLQTNNIPASIGFIQNNAGVLSLSPTRTGNEYFFDFTTYDYSLMLQNTGTGVLTYILTAENDTGSGIYINPIDDSGPGSIKYLGAEIIQDAEKNFIGKIFEVAHEK